MKRWLFISCCVAVMCWSGWQLYDYFSTYQKVEQLENEIQENAAVSSYENLRSEYLEMIGWITLDGTRINYPIMHTDNNDFYLTHNYKGEKLRAGSIFLDYRNDPEFSNRHSIIYGHDMRNGAMFGQLSEFTDADFAREHSLIQVMNGEEHITLQVFSAYETTTDFYYIETEFTDQTYEAFIQTIQEKSALPHLLDVTTEDQIVTLSTCMSDDGDDKRFVVHAKIIERNSE